MNTEDRKLLVKTSDTEGLKEALCPFFEEGGCERCVGCPKDEITLEDCKYIYESWITKNPMEVWSDEFEVNTYKKREATETVHSLNVGMNCDFCYMATKCPKMKPNHTCAIDWESDKPTNDKDMLNFLIDTQFHRVARAKAFEEIDGGVADVNASKELDRLERYLMHRIGINSTNRISVSVEATGEVAKTAGGGILAQLFGGGGSTAPAELPEAKPSAVESMKTDAQEAEIIENKPKRRRRNE